MKIPMSRSQINIKNKLLLKIFNEKEMQYCVSFSGFGLIVCVAIIGGLRSKWKFVVFGEIWGTFTEFFVLACLSSLKGHCNKISKKQNLEGWKSRKLKIPNAQNLESLKISKNSTTSSSKISQSFKLQIPTKMEAPGIFSKQYHLRLFLNTDIH
jgi:hypothetical protein